jgi:peptidyl-prolyl cis-trans isomerase D
VTQREFKEALQATKNQAIMQFGDKFTEASKYIDFNTQAWERLIALMQVNKRGIKVSDKEVEDYIAKLAFFQKNGQFDDAVYQDMLQYVFHTPARTFEEETRQNIALGKLFTEVTNDIKLSDEEIKKEYRKANEEISVNFIAALPSDFAKGISVKEEDLKGYFEKNSFKFKQPLSFSLEYIQLDTEKQTMDAAKRLNPKADFSKIAKDVGVKMQTTGFFTQNEPIPTIGWSPEILNIISDLKTGEYARPVHLDKSYYIFRIKERKEAFIPEFDKITAKVKEVFIKEGSEELAKNKIEEAQKKIKETLSQNSASVDLAKIAKSLQLKNGVTQPFKYGSYIEGVGASDALWMAAEPLTDGQTSDIISIPNGLYIVKVKSRSAFDDKKFQTDKEDFSKRLLLQKKQDYFTKFIDELSKSSGIPAPQK